MSNRYTRLLAFLFSIVLLSACAEKTPQEVAEGFWDSVISNDAKGAVKYSNLADVKAYDAFGKDWNGFAPSWGTIVIDGDNATIETTLSGTGSTEGETLSFDTILIRQDNKWRVDYARTGNEVQRGPFGRFIAQLGKVGRSLSDQFRATADELQVEMDRMGGQLDELSKSVGDQASETVEKYGEELRKNIKELAKSVARALEEHERELSDSDRQVLREVAEDLDEQSDELDDPTLQSIAEGGKSVAVAQRRLNTINNDAIEPYRMQWQNWGKRVEADMQRVVAEASALVK